MLKLPDFNALRIASGYGQTQSNRRKSFYLLPQWNIYKSPICRASHFGGEYSGKNAHNRKRIGRNSNGIGGQQEHYTVLGLAKGATSADIKKAFRTLARQVWGVSGEADEGIGDIGTLRDSYTPGADITILILVADMDSTELLIVYWSDGNANEDCLKIKYHPDVNKDPDADDSFKSIRLAYEVLSNETTRYQYDMALRLQESGVNNQWRESELNGGRRYSWAGMKPRARGVTWEDYFEAYEPSFYSYENEEFVDAKREEKAPVQDLLRYVWFTLFCCQILGSHTALSLFCFCAILNRQITASYKVAHMIAWLIGGQRGILLILALSFAAWFSGKQYDSLAALTVLALWMEVGIGRFFPIPRGAIMAMTYFSYKLQLELS